jgi:hypothetical protein
MAEIRGDDEEGLWVGEIGRQELAKARFDLFLGCTDQDGHNLDISSAILT